MTKSKSHRRVSQHSSKIHTSKTHTNFHPQNAAAKIILVIVFLAILIVIIATICMPLLTPEHRVKSQIASMATDYYENHLYKTFSKPSESEINNPNSMLEKYHTQGFAPVALRNLFLYDDQKNIDARDYIVEYCDEDSTFVKFYLDPPYEQTSYHYDITYSCNF